MNNSSEKIEKLDWNGEMRILNFVYLILSTNSQVIGERGKERVKEKIRTHT